MATHASHLRLIKTPRAQRAMEQAAAHANSLGSDYLGVEHMTLALVSESEGMFADAMQSLGFSRDALRAEIVRRLAEQGHEYTKADGGPEPAS